MHILFIGKSGDEYCEKASKLLQRHFEDTKVILLSRGEQLPANLERNNFDYIISYLSHLIIPEKLLKKAKKAAINFHPGTPDYPGIGCTNFALYNEETEYGVTCHHMQAKVDTGNIITVKRFPVCKEDSVFTLTQRCYKEIFILFKEILDCVKNDRDFPESNELWSRRPYTRAELNELGWIIDDMDDIEVKRRVRAMDYPGAPGAFIERAGIRFYSS